jgi:hypothetical protein
MIKHRLGLLLIPYVGLLAVPLYNFPRSRTRRFSVLLLVPARLGTSDRIFDLALLPDLLQ